MQKNRHSPLLPSHPKSLVPLLKDPPLKSLKAPGLPQPQGSTQRCTSKRWKLHPRSLPLFLSKPLAQPFGKQLCRHSIGGVSRLRCRGKTSNVRIVPSLPIGTSCLPSGGDEEPDLCRHRILEFRPHLTSDHTAQPGDREDSMPRGSAFHTEPSRHEAELPARAQDHMRRAGTAQHHSGTSQPHSTVTTLHSQGNPTTLQASLSLVTV